MKKVSGIEILFLIISSVGIAFIGAAIFTIKYIPVFTIGIYFMLLFLTERFRFVRDLLPVISAISIACIGAPIFGKTCNPATALIIYYVVTGIQKRIQEDET